MIWRLGLILLLAMAGFQCSANDAARDVHKSREHAPDRLVSQPNAEPLVRVLILENAESIGVTAGVDSRVHTTGATTQPPVAAGDEVVIELSAVPREGYVSILPAPDLLTGLFKVRDAVTGSTPVQNPDYEGILEIRVNPTGDGLNAIVLLPVEEYLRGVVPYEIGVSAPLEAMKAQAVAARSETLAALHERVYAGPHYDICSDVMCQVFRGINRRTENTDRAIRETRGIILAYNGAPLPAYYSASAGGHTEDIRNVWPHRDRGIPVWDGVYDGDPADEPGDLGDEANARAWLEARPNVFVNPDHHPDIPSFTHRNFRWQVTTSAEDLSANVARVKDIGRVVAIEPLHRGPSGRLSLVRFVGESGDLEVGPELDIRRIWQPLMRSSAFVVDIEGDPERPDAFVFTGGGSGHGVGMCQTGAMGRALAGQDYEQILTHYYRETELLRAYE